MPTLRPGDLVDFIDAPGTPPKPATVTAVLGAAWVDLRDEAGEHHAQIRVVTNAFQSPFGGCCLPRSTP